MPAANLANFSPQQLHRLATTAAVAPPYGIHSNFINPESRASLQVGVTSTVLAIAILFCLNRVYVKAWLLRRLTLDDVTLLIAVLASTVVYVASTWGAQQGKLARHNWDISLLDSMQPDLLVPLYLQFVMPPIALLFLKASFFIIYLQFFGIIRWARICCWVGLGLIAIIHTTIGTLSFVIASPYRSDWAHRAEGVAMAASVLGFIVDITILIIPIVAVERLELLSFKRKVSAILIFTTGALACLCSAFSIHARRSLINEPDQTWYVVIVNIATICELFIGIICACVPSAVYGVRNSNSIWRTLFSKNQSSTNDSAERKIAHHSSKNHQTTHKSSLLPDELRSTDKKYASYFALNGNASTVDVQKLRMAHLPHAKSAGP